MTNIVDSVAEWGVYFQVSGSPKAPLTTIAENWESSVTERNQNKADEDTSSDSESEGLSGKGC